MDDSPDSTDWTEVEGALERIDSEKGNLPAPSINTPSELSEHPMIERFGSPKGVVMEFRAGRIQKAAALRALGAWHDGQLEVATAQVREAVRAATTQARVDVEKFLGRLNQDYLEYLGELGLKNVGERQKLIKRLGEQTSQNLRDLANADWPQSLKDDSIERVTEMHKEFAERLSKELGTSDQ